MADRGQFAYSRGEFVDESGCVYDSTFYQVFAKKGDRTELAGGLTRLQAREICRLLNKLDRRRIGRAFKKETR